METLSDFKSLFQKIFPIISVLFIVAILIGLIVFRLSRNNPEEQLPPIQIEKPDIEKANLPEKNLNYDTSRISVEDMPTEISLLNITKDTVGETPAISIARKLGIDGAPSDLIENSRDGKMYIFLENSKSLTVSQSTISYEDKVILAGSSLQEVELKQRADSALVGLGILNSSYLVESEKNKKYIKISEGYFNSAQDFSDAEIIEFSFNYEVNGFPIVGNTPGESVAQIGLYKNGQTAYLNARFFGEISETSTSKLIHSDQAISKVASGEGTIVRTYIPDQYGNAFDYTQQDPQNFNSVEIINLSLIYYLNLESSQTLQPLYFFEGEITTSDSQKGVIEIYLPAVDYLTTPKP